MKNNPAEQVEALRRRAMCYLNTGRSAQAMQDLQAATKVDPTSSKAWATLGMALSQLGDTSAAIANFRKSLLCDPKNADAHNDLVVAYMANKQLDWALYHADCASAFATTPGPYRMNRVKVLLELGRDKEARDDLDAILNDDPQNQPAQVLRAVALFKPRPTRGLSNGPPSHPFPISSAPARPPRTTPPPALSSPWSKGPVKPRCLFPQTAPTSRGKILATLTRAPRSPLRLSFTNEDTECFLRAAPSWPSLYF